MPRYPGGGDYYLPPGSDGAPNTVIESARYNNAIHDIEAELNNIIDDVGAIDTEISTSPTIWVSDTPPVNAKDSDLWFEADTGLLFFLYNDGNSSQWCIATPMPDMTVFVKKSGDTMTGNLTAPGFTVTGGTTIGPISIELGVPGTSGNAYIDFHSGATVTDYDARIIQTAVGPLTFNGAPSYRFNGDINTTRSNGTTGVIYFGNASTAYHYFDGTNHTITPGSLNIGALNCSSISASSTIVGNVVQTPNYFQCTGSTGIIYLNGAANRYLQFDGSNYNLGGAHAYSAAGRLLGTNDTGLITNGRLAYVTDFSHTSTLQEPYVGAVNTGCSIGTGAITVRYRWMQLCNLAGGWYTVGSA